MQDEKVLLAKSRVLISKTFIDSNIGLDEFVSINTMLKEYDDMKEKIKKLKS